jgi:hypothetical protein
MPFFEKIPFSIREKIGYREPFDPILRFRHWIHGYQIPLSDPNDWNPIGEKLLVVAQEFQKRHQKPLVFVIDGADILAKGRDSKFFGELQLFAKNGADRGNLRIVFISSDGIALEFLRSKSEFSRARPVLELTEVDDESAIGYMMERKMPRKIAELAVQEITGGSFTSMNKYINRWSRVGETDVKQWIDVYHEMIWEEHVNKLEGALERIQIEPNHKIFHELIAVDLVPGFITKVVALGLFEDGERQKLQELVEENILSIHPDGGYRFNNRFVRTYFVKNKKQENKK